jgi:hypothetical protein
VRRRPQPQRSQSNPERSGVTLVSTPSRRARIIISVFIVSWLAWQVAVPLSYYAGDNVDDERFSWRMFSGVWLLQKSCTASVSEVRSQSGTAIPDTPQHVGQSAQEEESPSRRREGPSQPMRKRRVRNAGSLHESVLFS